VLAGHVASMLYVARHCADYCLIRQALPEFEPGVAALESARVSRNRETQPCVPMAAVNVRDPSMTTQLCDILRRESAWSYPGFPDG